MLNPTWWYFNIYTWKDILEVCFFSGVLYYFSRWLARDYRKPLVLIFYGYCTAIVTSYQLQLQTATVALITFAPVVLTLFMVLHQETLQRNFITLNTITPSNHSWQDWTEILMRSCLIAASHNKQIYCIIEKRNSLSELLETDYTLDCKLSEGLLELLIESNNFNPEALIWMKDDGTIQGVNSAWKKRSIEAWLAQEVKEQELWLQDALFFTAKTDALFFKLDPITRTFTLIAQGKLLEHVSAEAALKTIKKYLGHFTTAKKGDLYATGRTAKQAQHTLS